MTPTFIDKAIDWWTLGVLLYEMLSGLPPFYDGAQIVLSCWLRGGTEFLVSTYVEVTDKMYQKILTDPLVFGPEIGSEARSILTSLLDRDPTRRLGVNGADEIKKHPFFVKHIDFKKLLQKKIQPPFKPSVSSPVVSAFTNLTERCIIDGLRICLTGRVEL
jgi:serum/glucocorticoid-regulated kinase 2